MVKRLKTRVSVQNRYKMLFPRNRMDRCNPLVNRPPWPDSFQLRRQELTRGWRRSVVVSEARLRALGRRSLMLAAVSARRLPKLTLECAIKGRFRFVSDVGGDFRDASRCPFERSRRQLKPPAGQIRHGRLGEISGKALHQSGPRNAHLVREIRDRPRMGDAAMQQAEAFSHDGIARCPRAIRFAVRANPRCSAARYPRTSLGEFGKHGFAADSSRSGFFHQVQNGILQPLPGAIGPDVDLKDGRKSAQDRAAEVGVASHVPAHEPRNFTTSAGVQRTQVARLDLGADPVVREWPRCPFAAAHVVSIPMRKDDDISGPEFEGAVHPAFR